VFSKMQARQINLNTRRSFLYAPWFLFVPPVADVC
jgi:hypothetical protein